MRISAAAAAPRARSTFTPGKTAVKFNLPEAEAVDRLVDLIQEHGKWAEPEATAPVAASRAVARFNGN